MSADYRDGLDRDLAAVSSRSSGPFPPVRHLLGFSAAQARDLPLPRTPHVLAAGRRHVFVWPSAHLLSPAPLLFLSMTMPEVACFPQSLASTFPYS